MLLYVYAKTDLSAKSQKKTTKTRVPKPHKNFQRQESFKKKKAENEETPEYIVF